MIKADFFKTDSSSKIYTGFRIEGHSGYAEAGKDIVCASVSSMVLLFVNTVNDVFQADFDFRTDDEKALFVFTLKKEDAKVSEAIATLKACISSVEEDYPKFVKVRESLKNAKGK